MGRYITKRVAHSIAVIWVVATVVFFGVRAIPGGPVRVLLGGDASADAIAALREQLGLNQPLHVQYFNWLARIATGDFGESITTGRPVLSQLLEVMEPTLSIALLGLLIALLIAIPAGIISAVYQYEWQDHVATLGSFIGISMPAFWVGILLLVTFTGILGWFPAFGYVSIEESVIGWFMHVILPAIAVGVPTGGVIMRMMRSSMLEVLNEDYMRTARAKGIGSNLVLFKHGFQNALLPVVTIIGIYVGVLLAGAVSVEIVFGMRGMGRLLIGSISRRDYPVIQGVVLVLSILFVLLNLVIDIVYTSINPQIKYGDTE